MFSIWWERKVAGHMQSRLGPNRVGPIRLLQPLADGIKLILKEDLVPKDADWLLFRLAPYLAFAPAFAAFVALPFGPDFTFEPRLNVGVFWILAILSVEVMGVILAGWASNNKWSVYGAMREACQMVSYEIPLGISIIVGVMTASTPRDNRAILFILNCIGAGIFVTKALGIIFVQMWIRWTLPRPRIDQVLYACVKVLLPLACVLLLGCAIWHSLILE